MFRLLSLFAFVLFAAHCAEEAPENITVLVRIQPDNLAPAVSLNAHAWVNDIPAQQPFEVRDRPLDRFWVRLPLETAGDLRLDISAKDGAGCVVRQGTVETRVGPPYAQEVIATLATVHPPKC